MTAIAKCPVCDSENFEPHLRCEDHAVSREIFSIAKCNHCQLLLTSPRPNNDQMPRYYASPAYTSHIGTAATLLDRAYLSVRAFTLKWKTNVVQSNMHHSTGKRLLDFGCGTGEFLRTAKSQGWDITGMEPAQQARSNAAPNIAGSIKSSLQQVVEENKPFDAITLWHVLEHIDDLNSTLQQLKTLLKDSGTMFIAVPNHTSWDGKHYKENWAAYDVPRHLWHFAPDNMKALLAHHSLQVTKLIPMRLDAYYICLLSEKYIANSLTIPGLFKAFLNGCRSNFAARKTKNYSSIIYVVTK